MMLPLLQLPTIVLGDCSDRLMTPTPPPTVEPQACHVATEIAVSLSTEITAGLVSWLSFTLPLLQSPTTVLGESRSTVRPTTPPTADEPQNCHAAICATEPVPMASRDCASWSHGAS